MEPKSQGFKKKIVFIGIQLISIHVAQDNFSQGQICIRGEAWCVNDYVTISVHQTMFISPTQFGQKISSIILLWNIIGKAMTNAEFKLKPHPTLTSLW